MRTNKRPYKNEQTAAFAAYIESNSAEAAAARAAFAAEATEGFKHCGQYFAEKVSCECARAEGIDWDAIDEIFQYELAPVNNPKTESVEELPKVVAPGSDLPTKTLEVADKVVEPLPSLEVFDIGEVDTDEPEGYKTTDKSEGGVN